MTRRMSGGTSERASAEEGVLLPPRGAIVPTRRAPSRPWRHVADLRDTHTQKVLTTPAAWRGYDAALRAIFDDSEDDRVPPGDELEAALAYITGIVRCRPLPKEVRRCTFVGLSVPAVWGGRTVAECYLA